MSQPAATLREFALRVLEQGDLEAKLAGPFDGAGELLPDLAPGPARVFTRPARAPERSACRGRASSAIRRRAPHACAASRITS